MTTDTLTEATDLGFPVVRLHDTYSLSFQRPFGHSQQVCRQTQHATARDRDVDDHEAGIKWRNVSE